MNTSTKPLATIAMRDLIAVVDTFETNPEAAAAFTEHCRNHTSVIDVTINDEGAPVFTLAKSLATFLNGGVAA